MSCITFVTAFLNIYKLPIDSEIIETRFLHFKQLASTGMQICIYTEDDFLKKCNDLAIYYPNIKVMQPINIDNKLTVDSIYKNMNPATEGKKQNLSCFNLFNDCLDYDFSLPNERCKNKDTYDFMIFINSKYLLLENVIQENPWNSSYFAWFDFSISYIFKNMSESHEYLSCLSKRTLETSFFAIGGWENEKISFQNLKKSLDNVNWRFCGGFFLADMNSMLEFIELSKQYFPIFMNTYKKLTWEVNFWSWLETFIGWNPVWFHTMFDDGIIKIPNHLYCKKLKNVIKSNYIYPNLENFYPSSINHIFFQGKHILNTRYVNYLLLDNGNYIFCDPNGKINTTNIVSYLNENTMIPESHYIMNNESIDLKNTIYPEGSKCNIFGLEDVRLYEYKNKLRFIATNRNFSPVGKNRMVVGDYNLQEYIYENCIIIDSPKNCYCEKNWIPIILNNNEYFIYTWYPMEIYKVNYEMKTLELVTIHQNTINCPNFYKVRGSTTFVDNGKELLGVLHYSDDGKPRKYYHMLVSLDKETLCPLKYSEPFYFHKLSIEFCIGFWKTHDQYFFWVSTMDRNPFMIHIPINEIPLPFSFL